MRVVSGLAVLVTLAVLTQPALAVCIIRGGATTCTRDAPYPKYPNATQKLDPDPPAADPNAQTAVLVPTASSANAWVVSPQSANANAVVLVCGSNANC
ncbi:hypothetical protein [Dongia sedimenti]|uniref:Uncharacterized protein n=1 Tax=Dongia sedimenti TaxID=3064282 RepID=A0ABU0YL86_9PROT|nr:hypothetical protein [Rhodospirillaceae bacterium R-7]